MGRHSRMLGWCLLVASSLSWPGCKHVGPDSANATTANHQPPPQPAPPLEILAPPRVQPDPPHANPKTEAPPAQDTLQNPSDDNDRPLPFTSNTKPLLLPPVLGSAQPAPETLAAAELSAVRAIHRLASERFAGTPAYLCRFQRREQVDGKQRPEELILFKYRLEPGSIYMRWLGNEAKNRELVCVAGQNGAMVHVLPGINDSIIPPGNGRQIVTRPDSSKGLGSERYPVSETGIGAMIDRFGKVVEAVGRKSQNVGSLKYLGAVKRPEFEAPLDAVMQVILPGTDQELLKGGQRFWYFDKSLRFPVLVIAQDTQGQEVEYYCFDRFLFPGRLEDEEFNPSNLGRR
jgi:hypothetical protein